jgi:hypothetical protein
MSTQQKPRTHVRTSDIYYAAYLKVAGVAFAGMVREGNRVFFLFTDQEGMEELQLQYYNNVSKVPARPYAEEIKAFKALVFQA